MKAKYALPTSNQLWDLVRAASDNKTTQRVRETARRELNELGYLLERLNEYKTVREILRQVDHPDWEA